MNYSEFLNKVQISSEDIRLEIYQKHCRTIKIKKEKTINKNLGTIFEAALKIGNEKGFNAMSMRDLVNETGLSMGALYAYFSGKDELLEMLQETGREITRRVMIEFCEGIDNPAEKLRTAVKTHLFLSEARQPWFYFSYMEARHLNDAEREKAVASELETERILSDLVREGRDEGLFADRNPDLTASLIKAMIQDWYVKRGKHSRRNLTVDQYADFVIEFVEAFLKPGVVQAIPYGQVKQIEAE